jgi:Ca2+-transporting ATPase
MEGLTNDQVKERLRVYGKNEIKRIKKVHPIKIFIEQFTSPVVLILIASAIVLIFINYFDSTNSNLADIILILAIVVFSGIFGFIQDYKAEKSIEALKKLSTPTAIIIRNGKQVEIQSTEIVPGDILVLEGGNVIPADSEIIEGKLDVDESIITGESRAIKKKEGDIIYSGSPVLVGRATAKVTSTGMQTKIGKLAEKMQEIKEEKTPFQKQMIKFGKKISLFTVLLVIVIFSVSYFKFDFLTSFLLAVSLAIAAIPEGLPAVITLSLSLGGKGMVKKNALIRRLGVAESIGTVNIICSDKTGTITEGKMKVREFYFDKEIKAESCNNKLALQCIYFCNDAKKVFRKGKEIFVGDETDIALKEFSSKLIKEEGKRVDEIPFTSKRKMMSVIYKIGKEKVIFSKGAPEVLIEKCNRYLKDDKIEKLTFKDKVNLLYQNKEFAKKGMRVLALVYKKYRKSKNPEENLIWIGLVALSDPPREGVRESIKECETAGIRVMMITGDHPDTALSIAKEVGIKSNNVILGSDIDKMNDTELKKALKSTNIFARVDPMHKLRILKVLQGQGNIVAMTGDGVNDSLALKKADVGIAMGIKGTEVAKEASDIILLDDNFTTIKTSIKEGRRIFDNIRKFVNYLFSCNFAEVGVILFAILLLTLKKPILLPLQILWINLLTDGMPALALGMDPARKNIMKRKPREKNEPIIDKKLTKVIGSMGMILTLALLFVFFMVLPFGEMKARSALFTGFILYEFLRIGIIRYNEKMSIFANKWLVLALGVSLLLQLAIIYTPLNIFFHIVPLDIYEWGVLGIGMIISFVGVILINRFIIN